MTVRPLTTDDVELYRDIRLRALAADPGAFGSTYEREAAFTAAEWRGRLTGIGGRPAAFFVDELHGRVVGTAGVVFTESDSEPMLIGMWVDPTARGAGSGRRLLDAAVEWAGAQRASELILWVVKENEPAIALYEKYGFVPSGTVDQSPSNPCADELEMRLALPV